MAQHPLPHDLEAEMGVVGSLTINPEMAALIFSLLSPEMFHDPRCRKIYAVQKDLGEGLDFVTIQAELEARDWLKDIGPGFLHETLYSTPCTFHGQHYAAIVRQRFQQRQLIQLAARLTRQAFEPGEASIEEIITTSSRDLLALVSTSQDAPIPARVAARQLRQQIDAWATDPTGPNGVRGLSTGLGPLDVTLQGMQPGDLILLAGRPSMGKSALGFDVARRVAEQGGRVLIFSLEMSHQQVLARWVSALSGVPVSRMERGLCPPQYTGTATETRYLSKAELARCQQAIDDISRLENLTITDRPALTAEQIRAVTLSQAVTLGGLDLVVVDHTGLIDPGPTRRYDPVSQREGAKSRAMKALAKELGAPLLLIQQLNRAVEARNDKQPILADLRDSGEHEEHADVVLALYSAEYYETNRAQKIDKLEVLCLKHRRGQRQKRAELSYDPALSKFSPLPLKQMAV